jgi:F-type H+-transporting ATPase subunit c
LQKAAKIKISRLVRNDKVGQAASVRASVRVDVNHPLAAIHKRRNTMRQLSKLFMVLSALAFAMPAFAQGGGSNVMWADIAAGFSMAFASGICGLAQGKATAAAAEGLARNPAARPGITLALILGLALIESLALYTLVIVFAKVK